MILIMLLLASLSIYELTMPSTSKLVLKLSVGIINSWFFRMTNLSLLYFLMFVSTTLYFTKYLYVTMEGEQGIRWEWYYRVFLFSSHVDTLPFNLSEITNFWKVHVDILEWPQDVMWKNVAFWRKSMTNKEEKRACVRWWGVLGNINYRFKIKSSTLFFFPPWHG